MVMGIHGDIASGVGVMASRGIPVGPGLRNRQASSVPDVKDTSGVLSDGDEWASVILGVEVDGAAEEAS